MSSNYYRAVQADTWALGVVYGCYQVHQAHQPYPALLAFWVRKAIKRIRARKLKCNPKVLAYCEKWCKEAEASLTRCKCKCHRKARGKTQRWRSSS